MSRNKIKIYSELILAQNKHAMGNIEVGTLMVTNQQQMCLIFETFNLTEISVPKFISK